MAKITDVDLAAKVKAAQHTDIIAAALSADKQIMKACAAYLDAKKAYEDTGDAMHAYIKKHSPDIERSIAEVDFALHDVEKTEQEEAARRDGVRRILNDLGKTNGLVLGWDFHIDYILARTSRCPENFTLDLPPGNQCAPGMHALVLSPEVWAQMPMAAPHDTTQMERALARFSGEYIGKLAVVIAAHRKAEKALLAARDAMHKALADADDCNTAAGEIPPAYHAAIDEAEKIQGKRNAEELAKAKAAKAKADAELARLQSLSAVASGASDAPDMKDGGAI